MSHTKNGEVHKGYGALEKSIHFFEFFILTLGHETMVKFVARILIAGLWKLTSAMARQVLHIMSFICENES
jgi:hypothetical protein